MILEIFSPKNSPKNLPKKSRKNLAFLTQMAAI
jgi:hypothetical protein